MIVCWAVAQTKVMRRKLSGDLESYFLVMMFAFIWFISFPDIYTYYIISGRIRNLVCCYYITIKSPKINYVPVHARIQNKQIEDIFIF